MLCPNWPEHGHEADPGGRPCPIQHLDALGLPRGFGQTLGVGFGEAVGRSDPKTRNFIDRFTSFWTGVDESALARALAVEHRANPAFVQRVLRSLHNDYYTDADDVALEYVRLMRLDCSLAGVVRGHRGLRSQMIELMDEGWTSGKEQDAIRYLRGL